MVRQDGLNAVYLQRKWHSTAGRLAKDSDSDVIYYSNVYIEEKTETDFIVKTIIITMATITLWIGVEEALIEAGVKRRKWAEYVNKASMEKLQREKEEK